MKLAPTLIERWQGLVFYAREAANAPLSPTAADKLAEAVAPLTREQVAPPHHALQGLARGWAALDDAGRRANADALRGLAFRVKAVMEGHGDPGPEGAGRAAEVPAGGEGKSEFPPEIRAWWKDDAEEEDAA